MGISDSYLHDFLSCMLAISDLFNFNVLQYFQMFWVIVYIQHCI